MSTLILIEGARRCDATCTHAKHEKCDCVCEGRYHGAGDKAAAMLQKDVESGFYGKDMLAAIEAATKTRRNTMKVHMLTEDKKDTLCKASVYGPQNAKAALDSAVGPDHKAATVKKVSMEPNIQFSIPRLLDFFDNFQNL